MEMLKRNAFGQYADDRAYEIQQDVEEMFAALLDKHKDVVPYDVE